MLATLLMLVLTVLAQDAPPDAPALLTEFDALRAEMRQASDDFMKSLPRADDGSITGTDEDFARDPVPGFLPRFLELGRRAGATEAGARALETALSLAGRARDQGGGREVQREIAELLLARFVDTPHMARAAGAFGSLRYSLGSAEAEGYLRRTLEGTTVPDVKAAATFELARVLHDTELTPGESHMNGTPRTDPAPARALFEALLRDHPDSEPAKRAKGFLFELDHLQVGMVAPDIEAVDQDGMPFKLSDYRGKVVLLVFWGFW
jgi:hypothetical protein